MSSKRRNLSALVFLINSTTKANLIRILVTSGKFEKEMTIYLRENAKMFPFSLCKEKCFSLCKEK